VPQFHDAPPERRLSQFTELEHSEIKQISTTELTTALKQYPGRLSIRFASGISGYYVKYEPSRDGLVIIVAGPHGVESELADISQQNIRLLHERSEQIKYHLIAQSPF
jgi:hypothetical protein